MTAQSRVWTGGEDKFFLGIGELRALQQLTDAGPMEVYTRLAGMSWRVDDVYETIRLGLIGGGMEDKEARKLVNRHVVEPSAFYKHVVLAADIISISILGDVDDPVGETEPVAETMTNPLPENSDGQTSTKQE